LRAAGFERFAGTGLRAGFFAGDLRAGLAGFLTSFFAGLDFRGGMTVGIEIRRARRWQARVIGERS
jgi:hypothetical protein